MKNAFEICPKCNNTLYNAARRDPICPFCGTPRTRLRRLWQKIFGNRSKPLTAAKPKSPQISKVEKGKVEPKRSLAEAKSVERRLLKEQYELFNEVGRGAFGVVYKARDVHLDQFVAIKELILENPTPFKEEAKVLSELRHKNIVGFRQLFPDGGRWYLVMDYVEGGNLANLISGGALYDGGTEKALKRILLIAQQAAEGLGCAHERGVIHQDMKPANVMVDLKGVAKVSDFGLANARPQGSSGLMAGGVESILVTMGGMTPAYCSPEQANRQRLTKKTDAWSWGLTVLQMFTGGVTWRSGREAREVLHKCMDKQARAEIPRLPARVVNLLGRCFEIEPEARPDMNAIVAALADILGGGGGSLKSLPK